jgi:lipoate-protein ligase A
LNSNYEPLTGETARCRLILDPPASGAWNMAVDEALQLGTTKDSPLLLRFYGWTPATLSLGYFQSLADRKQHEASMSCPVTRRLSGGGAILHDRELTYSIIVPPGHPWSSDVQLLYDLFHQTLIETLAEWNVPTSQCTEPIVRPAADEPFLCFARRALGDVLLDGWKICGSAQRRRQATVLQHGSILLDRSPAAPELPGIAELRGENISPAELASAWAEHLHSVLGLQLQPSELTSAERSSAAQLSDQKYDFRPWIARR